MTIEARAKVEDIEKFRKKIYDLDAKLVETYSFTDHLYKPKNKEWDFNEQSMKIRVKNDGKVFLAYHLVEWDNGVKKDKFGFKKEIESLDLALQVVHVLNLEKVVEYSRKGEVYSTDDFSFVLENIDRLGYLVEVEAETVKKVDENLKKLGLTKISKSVPRMIQETLGG